MILEYARAVLHGDGGDLATCREWGFHGVVRSDRIQPFSEWRVIQPSVFQVHSAYNKVIRLTNETLRKSNAERRSTRVSLLRRAPNEPDFEVSRKCEPRLQAQDPNDFESNLRLAVLLKQDGDYDRARELLARALRVRPGDPGALRRRKRSVQTAGDRHGLPPNGSDESIAPARHGFDVSWIVSRVAQGTAQLIHCRVQAVLEIDEGPFLPDLLTAHERGGLKLCRRSLLCFLGPPVAPSGVTSKPAIEGGALDELQAAASGMTVGKQVMAVHGLYPVV